ncbi:MAG: CPBP family intramembrane metalloprotease [Thermoanaerobaculia bacterium]|nr:CPBP family intramembrane metalloprotease [Thermoanaerobaculia bacterium]
MADPGPLRPDMGFGDRARQAGLERDEMNLIYSEKRELRSGWKALRLCVAIVAFAIAWTACASALKLEALRHSAVHLAIVSGVAVELWLGKRGADSIGLSLRRSRLWKDALLGLAWGGASICLVAVGMVVITHEMSAAQLGQGIAVHRLPALISFWLLVAVAEEGLFRGYLLTLFGGSLGNRVAVLLSAGLFAVIHVINPEFYWFAFVYAFLLGMLLAEIVLKRGDLGCVIGFHFAWNLLQDEGLLNLPARGGEGAYMAVLLISLAVTRWKLPRRATVNG